MILSISSLRLARRVCRKSFDTTLARIPLTMEVCRKAACLTHCSVLNNGKSIGDRMLLTEKDIVCCPPPLFQ
jgi:hypothetical protein